MGTNQEHQMLQITACIRQISPEEFAKLICEQDPTIFHKAREDAELLDSFPIEKLFETLILLEKKLSEESDKNVMGIYKKFIIIIKGKILSFQDNEIAKDILFKYGFNFTEIDYNFDGGILKGNDGEGNIIELPFQVIILNDLVEIFNTKFDIEEPSLVSEKVLITKDQLRKSILTIQGLREITGGLDEESLLNPKVQEQLNLLAGLLTKIVGDIGQKVKYPVSDQDMR